MDNYRQYYFPYIFHMYLYEIRKVTYFCLEFLSLILVNIKVIRVQNTFRVISSVGKKDLKLIK